MHVAYVTQHVKTRTAKKHTINITTGWDSILGAVGITYRVENMR